MSEPALHRVTLVLCDGCLDGWGGVCSVPGCALFFDRAPDLSLRGKLVEEGPTTWERWAPTLRAFAAVPRRAWRLPKEVLSVADVQPQTLRALVSRKMLERQAGRPGHVHYRVTRAGRLVLDVLDGAPP